MQSECLPTASAGKVSAVSVHPFVSILAFEANDLSHYHFCTDMIHGYCWKVKAMGQGLGLARLETWSARPQSLIDHKNGFL